MKHIAISLFCLLIISCSYDKRITRTKYKIGDKAVIIHLPKGYQSWELTGGEEGKTFLFKYPDSSLVYISTMHPGGPIQDTIVKDTKAGGRLFAAWINNESLILSGVDDANHFWKNRLYKRCNVGYVNITENNKKQFDQIIECVTIREK